MTASSEEHGTLAGIGVGPGDPELMTLKGLRLLKAASVVAYPCKSADGGVARRTVEAFLTAEQTLLPMVYPLTADGADRADYEVRLAGFYDETAEALAAHLAAGRDVAVLCEGDPFLYGSFMYWHARLKDRFAVLTVPGVSSVVAGPVSAAVPLTVRDDALSVLPGTLGEDDLVARLRGCDAAVILKLGRTWPKVRRALDRAGVLERALYVERASHASENVRPATEVDAARPPYFSMVVVPSARPVDVAQPQRPPVRACGSAGRLTVLGLGPGQADWLTPEARAALETADVWVGYETYLGMAAALVAPRPEQILAPSDNRVERERAEDALDRAADGAHVALVSSGDPGIFAMAAAVMEALEASPERWTRVGVDIAPGISAMQAAAARIGAPLGHDFAVISLSDYLKPLDRVIARVRHAAEADLVLALYNPASRTRRTQLDAVLDVLRRTKAGETPVLVARDVGRAGETVSLTSLAALDPGIVDMRTLLIVGASHSRIFQRGDRSLFYTPRRYGPAALAEAAE